MLVILLGGGAMTQHGSIAQYTADCTCAIYFHNCLQAVRSNLEENNAGENGQLKGYAGLPAGLAMQQHSNGQNVQMGARTASGR